MKIKNKAPNWFIKLFSEGQFESKKMEKYVTDIVGYGRSWCEQNTEMVDKMLTNKQKDTVNGIMDRIETIKKYAWSRYFYENWELVKGSIKSPLSNASYDNKKQIIIISEPSVFKKAIARAGQMMAKGIVKRKIKGMAKKELKNKQ